MIRFYATRGHYVDHLLPIAHALIARKVDIAFHVAPGEAFLAADRVPTVMGRPPTDDLIVVAGAQDLGSYPRAVLVEHGAGQTYVDMSQNSWAGGDGRQNVVLFIVPNQYAAAANERRYPTPNVIAAPRIEYLRSVETPELSDLWYDVILGRHWDSHLAPELNSAWAHHFETLRRFALVNRNRTALHFHPRCADVGRTLAREWYCHYFETFLGPVMHAPRGVLVIDNSSAGFEWAALDRPVVWLNAPHYRRNIEQGLRFWSHVDVGMQVDEPENLEYAIAESLRHDPMADRRRELIADVYPVIDGAAEIAADAIMEVV